MARKNPDGSHKINRVAKVTGREHEGDKGLIVTGRNHARVANQVRPGQTADPETEELVKTEDVYDVRRIHDITTGKRQVVTLPKDLCRRLNIEEGTRLRIVEHEGRFEVIPMRLVAASEVPPKDLDALLARVTPENIHGEIDTGPSVGEEAW
jgi:antitoxin MazE